MPLSVYLYHASLEGPLLSHLPLPGALRGTFKVSVAMRADSRCKHKFCFVLDIAVTKFRESPSETFLDSSALTRLKAKSSGDVSWYFGIFQAIFGFGLKR